MRRDLKIFVAGHLGLAGSAIMAELRQKGYTKLLTVPRSDLDLRDAAATLHWFEANRPEYVILAAAKVGGILANQTEPASFLMENLLIETSVIGAAYRCGVHRLLFLGSSCIYPKFTRQPIHESSLLGGLLESTNRAYAIAKIAGIEMCWAYNRQYGTEYIAVMPTNLYGPGDNYHPVTSHVLPALLRKMHHAAVAGDDEVTLWGTGKPRREFLHAQDLARACVHLMELRNESTATLLNGDDPPLINIGTGEDLTIRELAELIANTVGYRGQILFDSSYPDGTPQKLLDVHTIHELGWRHKIDLPSGVAQTYADVQSSL